jgi:hypothetical protein
LGLKSDCKEGGFWGLKSLHFHNCTAYAVIWAEQQLVAIPGWLLEYQIARLDQEGQLATIKLPRWHVFKKNKAKRRTFYCEERGNKMVTQAFPPPPASGNFEARTHKFFKKTRGFVDKGGQFSRNLFNQNMPLI